MASLISFHKMGKKSWCAMKKNKMKFKLRKENHKKMPDKKQRKANMQEYLEKRMKQCGY